MAFAIATLWRTPEINSVSSKARSVPVFNPFNIYGRVFLLSWFGFFIAFWSWYAFPPLLTVTIKHDIGLSQADIANSNILGLVATLLVRLGAGSACDRFGARRTFAVILLVGAIPTALAGTVQTPGGLIAVRFFLGILGGTFIPCQVWTTGFFDKNVVGTANALTAGFGNGGSGVTYFLMPAIFDSLVQHQGLTDHVAWRVTFVIPFILITTTAILMILTCPDTPTGGSWSSRCRDMQRQIDMRDTFFTTVGDRNNHAPSLDLGNISNDTVKLNSSRARDDSYGVQSHEDDLLAAASWELVETPTYQGTARAVFSLPTAFLVGAYFATFGTELAVNSFLGAYYHKNFDGLGQTGSGNWAAMFGLLNVVFRPAGGIISDILYWLTGSLWAKKAWVFFLGLMTGAFLLVIGLLDPKSLSVMVGLMCGLAFFQQAANGACFSLVPHVHPTSNGESLL
ncbi:uncharacterized protein KY384_001557 [Bacidia gigantensis]|uniref:uncharacterized protein n=1 Tax=Bacidia gigantensis TaxID=2732470 RepID=UPI001D03A3CE|nr:uncharacterized protein KY384_001557 [Bacidia gigantensis]KAG8533816.1 hypothetical protein KY384_001557 [Bacidia gigantensis]